MPWFGDDQNDIRFDLQDCLGRFDNHPADLTAKGGWVFFAQERAPLSLFACHFDQQAGLVANTIMCQCRIALRNLTDEVSEVHHGIWRKDIQPVRVAIMPEIKIELQSMFLRCGHHSIQPSPVENTGCRVRNVPPRCVAHAHAARGHEELVIRLEEFIMSNETYFILAVKDVAFASNKV